MIWSWPKLFKFYRRPGLRRSSIRLLHQTGRIRRRRNSLACRVVNNWNHLPPTVASVTEQRKFKKTIRLIYLLGNASFNSIFVSIWPFWALCPFPISKYIHMEIPLETRGGILTGITNHKPMAYGLFQLSSYGASALLPAFLSTCDQLLLAWPTKNEKTQQANKNRISLIDYAIRFDSALPFSTLFEFVHREIIRGYRYYTQNNDNGKFSSPQRQ